MSHKEINPHGLNLLTMLGDANHISFLRNNNIVGRECDFQTAALQLDICWNHLDHSGFIYWPADRWVEGGRQSFSH